MVRGAELVAFLDALFGLALRLTSSREEAQDLVQETYARAIRALDRFAPGSNLRAWLFRILRNAWLDTTRASARRPSMEVVDEVTGDVVPHAPLRGDEDLERMRTLVHEEIEAALRSLSDDARMVVLLDLDGFTEAEIAEIMECAVGTVKSRLARARALLRERLADYRRSE